MKVILLSDIKGVGKKDQVIEASDGYARNFLFPKKLALEANAENMSKLKAKQDSNKFKKDTERKQAEAIAEKLKGIMLRIKVKAGGNGKIFGGVTSKEISDSLKKEYGFDIDKKKIIIDLPLNVLGNHFVEVELHKKVKAKLNIELISK